MGGAFFRDEQQQHSQPHQLPKLDKTVDKKSAFVLADKSDDDFAVLQLASACLINSLPRELGSIIIGYAGRARHIWATSPVDAPKAMIVDGNKVHWDHGYWGKIVSVQTVIDGPRKWKILVEFDENTAGWMAIGVTLSGPQNMLIHEFLWRIGSAEHVLATTAQQGISSPHYIIVYERNKTEGEHKSEFRSLGRKSLATCSIDEGCQFMRINAQGNEGEPIRELVLPLQVSGQPNIDLAFRPCIMLSGKATATIYPA
jgi:hypothetical protein